MIVKFLENLTALGTRPQDDPKHNQNTRLLNKVCLFVIAMITPHMLLTLYFGALSATLVQLVAVLCLGLTLYVNSRRLYNPARAMTLLIGNLHIFNMVLMLGIESGVYFYLYAAIIAPLFFYSSKELKHIVCFASLTILLVLVIQFLGTDIHPIADAPESLIKLYYYVSVVGSLLTVFFFVFHFYNESDLFEKALRAANHRLTKLSETDPLTQLPNRRSFEISLNREWGKSIRTNESLAVIMMDIDYFKSYNDGYGHQLGDECLIKIARIVQDNTREYVDFPVRFGGEEFLVLLSNSDRNDAYIVAERIRREILNLAVPHRENEPDGIVTCSFGVAGCYADPDSSPEDLIRSADRNLYRAKQKGRNRVEPISESRRLPKTRKQLDS
jgi:diguanylate cyclase (GGDEF)-like protein